MTEVPTSFFILVCGCMQVTRSHRSQRSLEHYQLKLCFLAFTSLKVSSSDGGDRLIDQGQAKNTEMYKCLHMSYLSLNVPVVPTCLICPSIHLSLYVQGTVDLILGCGVSFPRSSITINQFFNKVSDEIFFSPTVVLIPAQVQRLTL